MRKLKFILALSVLMIAAFVFSGCRTKTIDLNQYIRIEEDGYNTVGKVTVSVDYDALIRDHGDKIKLNKKGAKQYDAEIIMGKKPVQVLVESLVFFEIDKKSDLSNGDKIKLTWRCNDAEAMACMDVVLKYSDIEYTVSKLQEVEFFDPFEHIEIKYDGISPRGKVEVIPDESIEMMKDLDFSNFVGNKVKNGDTIKVKAHYNWEGESEFVEKYGCLLKEKEKEYVVSGLPELVSKVNQIPKEAYDKMDANLQKIFNDYVDEHWGGKPSSFKLIGNYLLSLKENLSFFDGSGKNSLYYVYEVTIHTTDDADFTYYWYGFYDDVIVMGDGTCAVDLTKAEVSTAESIFGATIGDYIKVSSDGRYVAGYTDLESLFSAHVACKLDEYDYDSTIQ